MANLDNNYDNEKNKNRSGPNEVSLENAKELVKDVVENPVETAKEFKDQAVRDVQNPKWWKKLGLVLLWGIIILVSAFFIIISLPVTKNWAAHRVMDYLNESLKSQISFKNVDLDYFGNITIHQVSVKDHRNFNFIQAKEVYADSNWFSIIDNSRNLQFQSLSLKELDMKVITYKGDSISNFVRFVDLFNTGPRDPKKPPFELKSRIYVSNSKVSIVNENSEGDAGKWLSANNLNINISELKVKGPEVAAKINNLRFSTERWGKKHFVETFSGNLQYSKDFLELKDLTLNTEHSLLMGNLKFNLNDGSWSDFSDKVRWEMVLKQGSAVSGYDISYFVTNWDNYNPVHLAGKMDGPLNNFALQDFLMGNSKVNVRTSKIDFRRLLKGNFEIETKDLSTDFTYKDLKAMLPTFISAKMKNFADDFGRLRYKGSVKLDPQQVYIQNGDLLTGIGQAKVSNFYLTDYSTSLPKFRGSAVVNDLNTSVITKNKQVGLISGRFNINGQSFDVNTMKLKTNSQISKIEIMGKEINNIVLEGTLDHKVYNGIINVNDEQAKADVQGMINFQTSRILANVHTDIKYLNLNYFTGAPGIQVLAGKIKGEVAMSNINDLNLNADLNQLSFFNGKQKYTIPNGNVRAFFENGNRIVYVDAPGAVTGKISGKYNLEDLAGMIQNGFSKILVGPEPRKLYRGQNFDLNFDVKQDLMSYFLPDVKIPKGALIDGKYDGNSNNLVLNVGAEELKYYITKKQEISEADKALAASNPDYKINPRDLITKDSAIVSQFILRINTANLEEQIFAKVDRLEYNKNVFKDAKIIGKNESNKLLHLSAQFAYGSPEMEVENRMKNYAINLNQSTNPQGDIVVRFEPTSVNLENVMWNIDDKGDMQNSITYRKKEKDFLIENFRVFSDESEVYVKRGIFKSGEEYEGDLEVKNLEIGKIFDMLPGGNSQNFEGLANGKINIKKDKNSLKPLVDMRVDNVKMNNEDLGNFAITAKDSDVPNVYDIEGKIVSAGIIGDNNLVLKGTLDNNGDSPLIDLKADMKEFDLKFANQFTKGIFSNMRGKANGVLSINGKLNDVDYNGDIKLSGFGLKLNFTGVDYEFDDTIVNLSKGTAILNEIGVKDHRSNSKGNISGAIYFETLSSMAVELVLNAENLMVLNTGQQDNDLFWGRVYGQGAVYVSGPVRSLSLETPQRDPFKALNNSTFTFNSNSTSGVDEFKMLRFLKEDKAGVISIADKEKSGANMNVDFNVAIDKGTTINVLVGDAVGDISVRGSSENINFRMTRQGAIGINGAYIVDNGTYVSKAILDRTFQIVRGSSIRWDGDAMAPNLDITANYLRSVTNAGDYLNVGSLPPVNVLLQAKISQTLNNPKINFEVAALDVSSQVRETLSAKMSQEDERIMQFGSVLLLNRFNTSNTSVLNVSSLAQDSGVNIILRQLAAVFNTISEQFQIDLNYAKGDFASNTGDRANANFKLAVSPRVTLKGGAGIPIATGKENATTDFLTGEGSIEYDASRKNDGTMVLRAYSKPMNIGMNTLGSNGATNQTFGVGVVYSKSFNTLFKRKKKDKKKKQSSDNNKVDSIKKDSLK